jgi:hypothetical protein
VIILLGNGRLGNQLFQYSFVRKEFPEHKIVLIGFDEAAELCDLRKAHIIQQKYFGKISYRVFRGVIALLELTRLISGIEEDISGPEFKIIKRHGFLFNIILIRNSFFQHEKFTHDLPFDLEIKSQHLNRAKFLLSKTFDTQLTKKLVFIHIRRGDYVEWPSSEFPAVLPVKWVFDAMEYFKERIGSPIFLIFTDDRQYVRDVFSNRIDIVVMSSENAAEDMAIMSLCNFGILSASTFSWWAANFARKNLSQTTNHEFIAPNFWAGHASGKWFPPNFYSQWLTYLPVDK